MNYRGVLTYLGIIILTFFIVRTFMSVCLITSYSMNNTLYDGDKVLIMNNLGNSGADARKNSIVVFSLNGENFVKRIIGSPGDTVLIVNGNLFVNNKSGVSGKTIITREVVKDNSAQEMINSGNDFETVNYYGMPWSHDKFGPYIIPRKNWTILLNKTALNIYGKLVLAETGTPLARADAFLNTTYTFKNDYYFVVGDNRSRSRDSRAFGPILVTQILGRVTMVLFSKSDPFAPGKLLKRVY